jgi:hypothetical protein
MKVKPTNYRRGFAALFLVRKCNAAKPGTETRPDESGGAIEADEPPLPSGYAADSRSGADIDTTRNTTQQRRNDPDDYRRLFMQTPKITDR